MCKGPWFSFFDEEGEIFFDLVKVNHSDVLELHVIIRIPTTFKVKLTILYVRVLEWVKILWKKTVYNILIK